MLHRSQPASIARAVQSAAALCLLLAAALAHAQAPRLEWVRAMGGDWGFFSDDEGRDIAVDGAGNVFTVGHMADEATASTGLQGGHFGFLTKHDATGNLEWILQLPVVMMAVAVDADGDVFASGVFSGVMDFGPESPLTSIATWGGMFLIKLTGDGQIIWAWSAGQGTAPGNPWILPIDMVVDHEGAVFVTGAFRGTYDFEPESGLHRLSRPQGQGHPEDTEVFVCKIDAEGGFRWARQTVSLFDAGTNYPAGISLDAQGDVRVNASSSTVVMFGRHEDFVGMPILPLEQEGRYFPTGNGGFSYTLDPSTGEFRSYLSLDRSTFGQGGDADNPGLITAFLSRDEEQPRVVIVRIDTAGAIFWSWSIATDSFAPWIFASDDEGNVYAAGRAIGVAFPAGNHSPAFTLDEGWLLLKLNRLAELEWAYPLRATAYGIEILGLATVEDGGVYATGYFKETVDFGGVSEEHPLTTEWRRTVFIMKIDDTPPPSLPGDINGDGGVNALDVQLAINAALGIALPPGLDADANGDGQVDAVDVQWVINMALGLIMPMPAPAAGQAHAAAEGTPASARRHA